MAVDIVPELIKNIQLEFAYRRMGDSRIRSLENKAIKGTASYRDAHRYATEIGNVLSKVYKNKISSSVLPDGKMYYNIAKRLLNETLVPSAELVGSMCKKVQESMNDSAGLGIKAKIPDINQDRINGLIDKLSDADNYDDVAWVLGEPVINLHQNVVDDYVEENVKFHGDLGLKPIVVRTEIGNCCDWCKQLVGKYTYPDVPREVYMRHSHCRCTVHYIENGTSRNIWTKAEEPVPSPEESTEAIREQAKVLGLTPGKKMSFSEADSGSVNPHIGEEFGYSINCQSCVVTFEARQRGYDVEVLSATKNSSAELLSRRTNMAWIDPETGTFPEYIRNTNAKTPKEYLKFMKDTIKPEQRYTIEFGWKGRGHTGHIVNLDLDPEGNLRIKDNQRKLSEKSEWVGDAEVFSYLKEMKYVETIYGNKLYAGPKMLRIDNLDFNSEIVDGIMKKHG